MVKVNTLLRQQQAVIVALQFREVWVYAFWNHKDTNSNQTAGFIYHGNARQKLLLHSVSLLR